jgi:hypothetical protein
LVAPAAEDTRESASISAVHQDKLRQKNMNAEMMGTKEVAAKLKIEPRYLRMMLRKINGRLRVSVRRGPTDPFLKKLPDLIKAEILG